ncbi:MAG: hypothetical protein ACXV8M_15390, partial [Candidatus Angelobacter sp.]
CLCAKTGSRPRRKTSTFPARAVDRAYDRVTSYDNSWKDQNATLPHLSWLRAKRRNAVHRL